VLGTHNVTILIVEDNRILAEDLRDIVSGLGYETSGLADSFETARRLAPFSTIAFVDVNLADGATGPRIGQYLAAEFGISVVMVTANPDAIGTGLSKVVGVLSKPVHPTLISNVLDYIRAIREDRIVPVPSGMRLFS